VIALAAAQAVLYRPSEPCFKYDESRHLMTGVFFRDFFIDHPLSAAVDYVIRYYLQYPALGLIVWPPLFYAVEGLFMMVFGTSLLAAKVLVGIFGLTGCLYLYLLARRTHGEATAILAAAIFGFSPLVFTFSHQVMLEIPTAAFALGAIYHLVLYLETGRKLQVFLAGAASAAALLTRFDAAFLLPCLFLLTLAWKRRDVLLRREVWASAALVLLLVAPFYWITASQFGWMHLRAIEDGTYAGASHFLALGNFLFYPSQLPTQMGWPAALAAVGGLCISLRGPAKAAAWPYLAAILAAYLTFSPMAELDPRHTIYWVAPFSLFAARGLLAMAGRLGSPVLGLGLASVVLLSSGGAALARPASVLRGYEEAAGYVLDHMGKSRFCLIDCYCDANFIYQMRRRDARRERWVLRGDKILYGTLGDPQAGYQELVKSDAEVLEKIYRYDPEFILVDDPRPYQDMAMARRLRQLLKDSPDRFRLERVIPLRSSYRALDGVRLLIYRNLARNPRPSARLEVEMMGLRRSISTDLR
jgi:hypothetical protein